MAHRIKKNFQENIGIEHNIEANITIIYRDILCGVSNGIKKFLRNNIKLYSRYHVTKNSVLLSKIFFASLGLINSYNLKSF